MSVRVGVVGVGFMGKAHFDCHRANSRAEVVAICDVDEKKLAGDWSSIGGNIGDTSAAQVNLTGIKTYRKLEDLLADPDVDLVDITLPTYLHAAAAVKALKAGKHVLCEKPLAIDSKAGRKVVQAARKAKGYFMVAHCIRFWPEYAWLKKVVDEKRYGKVLSATFWRLSPTPTWSWRNWLMDAKKSKSAALDLHVHDADFVQYLFGKPRAVFARGASGRASKGIDHIVAQYVYGSVPQVMAEGGWIVDDGHGFVMAFRVICEKATILFDSSPDRGLHVYQGTEATVPADVDRTHADGWAAEIDYLHTCIEQKQKPKVVTPGDALRAVQIIEAELKSIKTKKAVALPK